MARNKTCPPGVICIENITMVLILICVGIVGYFYINIKNNTFATRNSSHNAIERVRCFYAIKNSQ